MPMTTWTDVTSGLSTTQGPEVSDGLVTATGTTTTRTLEDRFGEEIHAFDFLPAGQHQNILARTSTYDATDDLQAAIDAAEAAGGARVRLPRGTILHEGGLIMPDTTPVLLVGDGMGCSILKAAAVMDQQVYHGDYYVVGGGIRDMTLEGNKLAARNIRWISGNQTELRRVAFDNATLYNMHLGAATNGAQATFLFEMMMSFCKSRNDPNLFTDPADLPDYNLFVDVWVSDSHFSDIILMNAKVTPLYAASSVPNHFERIHTYGYPDTHRPQYGFWTKGGATIHQCHTDDSEDIGYFIDGDNVNLCGNIAYWISGHESGTGVTIKSGAANCAITGNVVHSLAAADKIVQLGTASATTSVIGNAGASYEALGTLGRLDLTGPLRVGASGSYSGIGDLHVNQGGTGFASSSGIRAQFSNDAAGPYSILAKSRATTVGLNGVVQAGDSLGHIAWHGNTGSGFAPAASIRVNVDSAPGVGDMPGRLVFATTADGAAVTTDRVELTSNGTLRPVTNNTYSNGDITHRWSSSYTVILDVSGATTMAGAVTMSGLVEYADDAAAAAGGLVVGRLYRTGSVLKVRVS